MPEPNRRDIVPRPLGARERSWIQEILQSHAGWADVDLTQTQVVGECSCGECNTVYLDSPSAQNPRLAGTRGYIGRIEIRTNDEFGITITLDQSGGKLSELYVSSLDLSPSGNRRIPAVWTEKARVVTKM